jgi:hypothetical protein
MGTKHDDETLAKAHDDEPLMVIRATDIHCEAMAEYWLNLVIGVLGPDHAKVASIRQLQGQQRVWQLRHPDLVKHPD